VLWATRLYLEAAWELLQLTSSALTLSTVQMDEEDTFEEESEFLVKKATLERAEDPKENESY